MGNYTNKKLISGILSIPCQKPPIEQIIYSKFKPAVYKILKCDDTLIIRGNVTIFIEYSADVETKDQPVHFCHFVINFDDMICKPSLFPLPDSLCKDDIDIEIQCHEIIKIPPKRISYLFLLNIKINNVKMYESSYYY
ncbi:DUF3794 domain-containing protein [Oceanirhabdus sp. W0125-5]|uniref:DUF3794 domain-containing protein n=1 Tax=Oceanirhabdus sp. W0125-5 TaxID=2999116 RepID=UPI0022F2CDDE|nr:DUF3794 domain-containing protein [Oceanirhabdus sp. W0125-5]WBW96634.1 DUF3794 domain-containing protein [Oceanirhabdus sp. W0125-5]